MTKKGEPEKNEYKFSKRNAFRTIIFGIIPTIIYLTIYFITIYYTYKPHYSTSFLIFLTLFTGAVFSVLTLSFYYLIKRTLIINDNGIKFFMGNKLKFGVSWG
jgi:hypothetical protein